MSYHHLLWWNVVCFFSVFIKHFQMKLIIALKFCDKIQNKYKNIIKRRITLCHTGTYIYHSHYIRMWFMWFDSCITHQQKSLQFKFFNTYLLRSTFKYWFIIWTENSIENKLTGHFIHTFSCFNLTCSRNLKVKMIVSVISNSMEIFPLDHLIIFKFNLIIN